MGKPRKYVALSTTDSGLDRMIRELKKALPRYGQHPPSGRPKFTEGDVLLTCLKLLHESTSRDGAYRFFPAEYPKWVAASVAHSVMFAVLECKLEKEIAMKLGQLIQDGFNSRMSALERQHNSSGEAPEREPDLPSVAVDHTTMNPGSTGSLLTDANG